MKIKKRLKWKTGVTLVELIIAVAIIAVAMVPIFNMLTTSVSFNAQAHKITVATFTAQLKMEELVGLNAAELIELIEAVGSAMTPEDSETPREGYNGFYVTMKYEALTEPLYEVTVTVYENLTTSEILCRETNIINTNGGYIPPPTTTPAPL